MKMILKIWMIIKRKKEKKELSIFHLLNQSKDTFLGLVSILLLLFINFEQIISNYYHLFLSL